MFSLRNKKKLPFSYSQYPLLSGALLALYPLGPHEMAIVQTVQTHIRWLSLESSVFLIVQS